MYLLIGLHELTLSANPGISTKGWTKFFISMSASCCLKTLNLDYNTIGDYGAGCLAVVLASNNTIEVLDLEGTGISEFGAQVSIKLSELNCNNAGFVLAKLTLEVKSVSKRYLET